MGKIHINISHFVSAPSLRLLYFISDVTTSETYRGGLEWRCCYQAKMRACIVCLKESTRDGCSLSSLFACVRLIFNLRSLLGERNSKYGFLVIMPCGVISKLEKDKIN